MEIYSSLHLFPFLLSSNSLHALRGLSGNVDENRHLELLLQHVQMLVQARAFAPLRDDRQPRPGYASHEQQNVAVSGFPENEEK